MSHLTEGQLAPDFTLSASGSEAPITLSALRGKTVVLFFYPKDDTPGCTVEACAFRDQSAAFAAQGAVVLGISRDGVASKAKFATKFNLSYPLLADENNQVAQAYGIWVEKMNYGKTYLGIERTTFVIAPDGSIKKIFRKVKPEGHAEQVLALLEEASA